MKNMGNTLRGPLTPDFLGEARSLDVGEVVFVADPAHRLEYSFGIDVLKYKPLIRQYVGEIKALGRRCGIETDFRHENILHAGDCGVDFVEIDVSNYLEHRDHYALGIEIANERGIGVVVSGDNAAAFAADMPGNLVFSINTVTNIH